MMLIVVAVRDSAVGAFGRPLFVPSIGVAIRSFADEINRVSADNMMQQHPSDFELWYIGEFTEETGSFSVQAADGMRCLSRGKDMVRSEK